MPTNEPASPAFQPHIVIVDRHATVRYLAGEGYRVTAFGAEEQALARMRADPAALVLLCKPIQSSPAHGLLATIQRSPDTAVIIMNDKDEPIDRVAELERGADDYVLRSIHQRELLARIRSRLRRVGQSAAKEPSHHLPRREYHFGEMSLDPLSRELRMPHRTIKLSDSEFRLLTALLENPRTPLSRENLLRLIHDGAETADRRSIDVNVGRLRHKIETHPKRPTFIKTIRNAGYIFDVKVRLS